MPADVIMSPSIWCRIFARPDLNYPTGRLPRLDFLRSMSCLKAPPQALVGGLPRFFPGRNPATSGRSACESATIMRCAKVEFRPFGNDAGRVDLVVTGIIM